MDETTKRKLRIFVSALISSGLSYYILSTYFSNGAQPKPKPDPKSSGKERIEDEKKCEKKATTKATTCTESGPSAQTSTGESDICIMKLQKFRAMPQASNIIQRSSSTRLPVSDAKKLKAFFSKEDEEEPKQESKKMLGFADAARLKMMAKRRVTDARKTLLVKNEIIASYQSVPYSTGVENIYNEMKVKNDMDVENQKMKNFVRKFKKKVVSKKNMNKGKVTLYVTRYSVNCHSSWILCRMLEREGVFDVDIVDVDIVNAGQMTAEYLAINPMHTVPAFVDVDGTSMWEGHTIIRYLCNKYCNDSVNRFSSNLLRHLYPVDDAIKIAKIESTLDWRLSELYKNIAKATYLDLGWDQNIHSKPKGTRRLPSLFDELERDWLKGQPWIGGEFPSIADLSIVPSLQLLEISKVALPKAIEDYCRRFQDIFSPVVENIYNGEGGLGIKQYIEIRRKIGAVDVLAKKSTRKLVNKQDYSLINHENYEQIERISFSSSNIIDGEIRDTPLIFFLSELSPACIGLKLFINNSMKESNEMKFKIQNTFPSDEYTLLDIPGLSDSRNNVVVHGFNACMRYLCLEYKNQIKDIEILYPSDVILRSIVDNAMDFCSGLIHPLLTDILGAYYGITKDFNTVATSRRKTMEAFKVFFDYFLVVDLDDEDSSYIGGSMTPTIADYTIIPYFTTTAYLLDMQLPFYIAAYCNRLISSSPALRSIISKWQNLRLELNVLPEYPMSILDTMISQMDDQLHHLGSVNDQDYLLLHNPNSVELPSKFSPWVHAQKNLSQWYQRLIVRQELSKMPLLDASVHSLPDRCLAKASSIISMLSAAYWHSEFDNTPKSVPDCLLKPWEIITKRLGRDALTINYEDIYTYNWSGSPGSVTTMRLATPTTGSVAEQRFYLGTVAITYAGAPIIRLACRIHRAILLKDNNEIVAALKEITGVIKAMVNTFKFLSLRNGDVGYVDPIVWTVSVATFAMTWVENLGHKKPIAPSGNSLPILHYIDAIIGRLEFTGELAETTLKMRSEKLMAPNHLVVLEELYRVSIHKYVVNCNDVNVKKAWNDLILTYLGPNGFLGKHRKKVYGYIIIAAIVGRPKTLLDTSLSIANFTKATIDVNQLLVDEIFARTSALTDESKRERVRESYILDKSLHFVLSARTFNEISLCVFNNEKYGYYVVIDKHVFDLTQWAPQHPGGHHNILLLAGLDGTESFRALHNDYHWKLLESYLVGNYEENKDQTLDPHYTALKRITLLMNIINLEFESLLKHRTKADTNGEHIRCLSPFNFMLLLRHFRKCLVQLYPTVGLLFGDFMDIKRVLNEEQQPLFPNYVEFQNVTTVPDRLRSVDYINDEILHQVNSIHQLMLKELARLRNSVCRYIEDRTQDRLDEIVFNYTNMTVATKLVELYSEK